MTRRIAFYAPMKSPRHSVPSGDREMAHALMLALGVEGVEVDLVSELRLYEGKGDPEAQATLQAQADQEITRLIDLARAQGGWQAWFTYHNYYKAPDLIGPTVAATLGIPYAVAEPSRADKRLTGPWAGFERKAGAACDAANVLFHLTKVDREVLMRHARDGQTIRYLRPFLPVETLPPLSPSPQKPVILAAGMMRPGDKLASYRQLAAALSHVTATDWELHVAGDGPARTEVQALLDPLDVPVRYLGQLDRDGMTQAYRVASAMVWPGVNEAFGMVYLEAQAQGCPALAEDRVGPDTVLPRENLLPQGDAPAQGAALDRLLTDRDFQQNQARAAQAHMVAHHLLDNARETLWGELTPLLEKPA